MKSFSEFYLMHINSEHSSEIMARDYGLYYIFKKKRKDNRKKEGMKEKSFFNNNKISLNCKQHRQNFTNI